MRTAAPAAVVLTLAVAPSTSSAAPEAPAALSTLLDRGGAYVVRYAGTFRNLVAEESYRQWWRDPASGRPVVRTLRSELVFVTTPGSIPWGTFRDVFEVDGQPVRDRGARLEELFAHPDGDAFERARRILDESARFNLGDAYRNVNVPNLAMLFLEPANQGRLAFKALGTGTVAGFAGVEVSFVERARPTIVRGRGGEDVPAQGRFWIDPGRGTVLRAEIDYDLERNKLGTDADRWERAAIRTDYRREAGLDVFVPDVMRELYVLALGRVECVARYARYRRFEVRTEERAQVPAAHP